VTLITTEVFGLSESRDPHFDETKIKNLPLGRVLEKQRGEYRVFSNENEILCGIRSRLRKSLIYPQSRERRQSVDEIRSILQIDPVAVGDIVRFTPGENEENTGVIEHVEQRRNQLSRRASGLKPVESVICANVDILFIVFSLKKPVPKPGMIDRFLIAANWEDIPAVLVLNKTDLANESDLDNLRNIYNLAGCKILPTCALTGDGVPELKNLMVNKTSVLAGPSGTGKSSLLNKIQPGLGLKVSEISKASGKGKHTTAHLQAFPLKDGGMVLDTPGIKQLALWNLEPDELITLFPEMEPLAGKCKFGLSCGHNTEPGCAVKKGVDDGSIHPARYKNLLRIYGELEELYGPQY